MSKQGSQACLDTGAESTRLSSTAYIKPLSGPLGSPVSVTVLGPPNPEMPGRSIPAAKDSKWATDRCSLA